MSEKDEFILGIEVDGYAYHDGQGFDKYLDDLSRQDFLENKEYNIYRIKEINFKLSKQKIINELNILINKAN
ncbi:hypothetical protein [Spiroplasma endosymbiont of Labia minor]|uniref:hypothetical protein n=1 Tax=Spiroplasma endosymbiont of Labia minor TaxID=3066305 RepID=UPI0030CAA91A